MIEALWITQTGVLQERARSTMTMWVVALLYASICRVYTLDGREYVPERVAYNKQRHVLLVRTAQDIVCLCLDHVTIDDDDLFLAERLLSYLVVS